jgi:hypothetical protein
MAGSWPQTPEDLSAAAGLSGMPPERVGVLHRLAGEVEWIGTGDLCAGVESGRSMPRVLAVADTLARWSVPLPDLAAFARSGFCKRNGRASRCPRPSSRRHVTPPNRSALLD